MVTASVGFLVVQASTQVTLLTYFEGIYKWYVAGDIYVSSVLTKNYLNEVPISAYLDQFTQP